MTARSILLGAAALVRKGWCQFELAQDSEGRRVSVDSKDAARWCAYGALIVASGRRTVPQEEAMALANAEVEKEVYREWIPLVDFNNAPGRTSEEVAQALERAAAMCGS